MTSSCLPYQNAELLMENRARDLLSRLGVGEKIALMLHESPAIERLGIPQYNWWNECLHGVARAGIATVFPQAIGLAAMFDAARMHRVATAISDEARAKHHANVARGDRGMYKGLNFWTPNINIFRDPRWGRGQETYGECPYLTGRMAVAFIRGLQGDHPVYYKVAATAKHFAAHSGPELNRHSFNARVSPRDLRQTYLPAFRDCVVEARVESIMGAYNRTNDEPCCGSPTLLETILRGEWKFAGHVVSDCGAVEDFHQHHGVTNTPEESAALAVRNGCDLNCGCVYGRLLEALQQGLITEAELDRSVLRLLRARFRLGMFDPPERVPWASVPFDVVDSPEHRALALDAARASIILLKNQGGLLPLRKNLSTIAVIGPNADDRAVLLGNYNGIPSKSVTPLDGIRNAVAPGTKVLYQPGCEHIGRSNPVLGLETRGFAEALLAAEQADVVVLCLGLTALIEGEEGDAPFSEAKGDRTDIALPTVQQRLLEAIAGLGKPIVLVVLSGSAIAIPWAQAHVPAILQQFYPGEEGGTALAEVLFGDVNPAGRLPVTVYRGIEQLPPFDDYTMKNRTYRFFDGEPLYPFGFGLSYTQFAYTNARIDSPRGATGQPVTLHVDVANVGQRHGEEVVQVYLEHVNPPLPAPIRELCGFRRVWLAPGETITVSFSVEPRRTALVDEEGRFLLAPGHGIFHLGGSQPDAVSRRLGAAPTARIEVEWTGERCYLDP